MIEPASTRSSKKKKRVKDETEESNEDGDGADGSADDGEEEMDYSEANERMRATERITEGVIDRPGKDEDLGIMEMKKICLRESSKPYEW